MKRHPTATMIGGAILAARIQFWTFASGLSTIDFMRSSSGHASIGTFYLPASLSAGLTVIGIGMMVYAFILLSQQRTSPEHSGVSPASARLKPDDPTSASMSRSETDVFHSTVILPGGRAVRNCTIEDLALLCVTILIVFVSVWVSIALLRLIPDLRLAPIAAPGYGLTVTLNWAV